MKKIILLFVFIVLSVIVSTLVKTKDSFEEKNLIDPRMEKIKNSNELKKVPNLKNSIREKPRKFQ